MKSIMYALVLLCCFATAFSQNIFIANSNPGAAGGTRVFTGQSAIINAIAAASNGDIIYVVPSNVYYFQFSLFGKSVSLIGGGFNPDKPGGPLSTIENIFGLAGNIRVSGLVVTGTVRFAGAFSNIIIEKCRIGNLFQAPGESTANLIIQNCIIGENSVNALHLTNESSNVVISNNIFYAGPGPVLNNLNGAIVRNNLFIANPASLAFGNLTQCNIQNNIFYGMHLTPAGTFTDNDQVNNLLFFTSSPFFSTTDGNTSSGNIRDQDPMFTNFSYLPTFSFSFDLTLQTGSPAIGSGLGGIDMGVFGGPNPFDMHGTSLPIVQNIIAPLTVPQGNTMNVRIQAKGN